MSSPARIPMVGLYELVMDFESPDASVRVFRVSADGRDVEPHIHQRCNQIYVALEGRVIIERDGVNTILEPFHALTIPRGTVHGAKSAGEEALVLNISVPPLQPDDQVALPPDVARADLQLPGEHSDLED